MKQAGGIGSDFLLRWAAVGLWLGLLDGTLSIRAHPDLAGPWLHRAGELAVAMLVDGALCVTLAVTLRGLLTLGRSLGFWFALVVVLGSGLLIVRERVRLGELPGAVTDYLPLLSAAAIAAGLLALLGSACIRPPTPRVSALAALAALVLVVPTASIGNVAPRANAVATRPNVILISLDTLRADHLGCYGYDRATSPNLDALARDGILFERAFSQSHYTLPSHASMLTGLSPAAVGVLEPSDALDEAFETLAEQMSARGYRTGALVGRGAFSFVGSARGFAQGFEDYHHWPYWPTGMSALGPRTLFRAYSSWINHHVGVGSIQITRALNWVERRRDEPFFLFLHLFDIHSKLHRLPYEAPRPYREMFCADRDSDFTGCHPGGPCASEYLREMARGGIPEPLSGADLDRTICLYDGGIRFVDAEVGRFLDALQEMELYDDSLIVVVSDHGEAFFEHGRPLHSDFYNENLHVPLILKPPGGGGGLRVAETARVLDIAPTLLSFTPGRSSWMQGESLLQLSGGAEEGERLAFAQSHRGEAVQSVESKLIAIHHDVAGNPLLGVEMELYELLADPGEQNDVHGELEEAGAAWEARLSGHRFANEALYRTLIGESAADELQLPEEAIEELKSLGYL